MPIAKKIIRNALMQTLNEKGFTFTFEGNDDFYMIQKNRESRHISFQLIISGKTTIRTHGSHNGNKTDGIGVFLFDFYTGDPLPDYFIFGLENRVTACPEFVIVSYSDLFDRLSKRNLFKDNKVEMWLWLMPDNYVYETTNISLQSEWYLLSKRNSGSCMADDTEIDYSMYMKNWIGMLDSSTE